MAELVFFIFLFLLILIPASCLLGKFIAENFSNEINKPKNKLEIIFEKIESPIFKLCGVNPEKQMSPKEYFFALFWSNVVLSALCYLILYFQNILPYKGPITWQLDPPLILHILSSLITNTCQTHHIPEEHLSSLSNFFVMPLLMFYSSGSGLATGISFMRAITKGWSGNAYVDCIKAMIRILFPGCLILTLIYCACGMPNTFTTDISYQTLENVSQRILLGPVAAFEAIKLFGENGLSCFNANSAHPYENPSYLSNFIEIVTIFTVPFALIITLGFWLKNHKQSAIILGVLVTIMLFEFITVSTKELNGNHLANNILSQHHSNWVGKETRLGIIGSSIFEAAVSNVSGSANASLDSFHPLINAFGLFNLSNQSIFGVQGFGTVFTINFILYTAFFVGIILGRTPEIFGRRIEKNEIILSSVLLLLNPLLVLFAVAFTLFFYPDNSTNAYEHLHYYTRVFYEFASGAASNGSGLEGLADNTGYWNLSLAIVMFLARYGAMSSMILLGGSLASKPALPASITTFRTDTILFAFIFLFMSIISTILIYSPFILLSPLAEVLINR